MQTLDRPILHVPDLSTLSADQVIPGDVPPEQGEGRIGGAGPEPEPLQGGTGSGDEETEERTGNEGAGT
jgi:hypothetical protein